MRLPVRAIVPAYFHPLPFAAHWAAMQRGAQRIGTVVLNVADGPGRRPDPTFREPLARLQEAGVCAVGYVDTAYGERPPARVLDDLVRHRLWYRVDGVFFDRVSAGWDHLEHYAALAAAARAMGARTVVFNHGTHPVRGYLAHADLLGTFEGDGAAYAELALPQWVRSEEADRFFHLVYGVPRSAQYDTDELVSMRNVGSALVTERDGVNPWDRLPGRFLEETAVVR